MATIEELQQELQKLQDEVRVLSARIETEAAEPSASGRFVSRRNLLRAAPIAAIGGAVAAMTASPAAATAGQPVLLGRDNDAGFGADGPLTTTIESPLDLRSSVDMVSLTVASDVAGFFNSDQPLVSIAGAVVSEHPFGQDALAVSSVDGGTSISVTAADGPLWQGGPGSVARGTAISATSQSGTTIEASTLSGQVLAASSTSPTTAENAVSVDYAGEGHALLVQSHNPSNDIGAVTGVGGTLGRGGQFSGGIAALRLVPSANSTHPWSGRIGDLMVDASSRLWFCTKANTSSVAATWKQIG
jgi:hypothetical protein